MSVGIARTAPGRGSIVTRCKRRPAPVGRAILENLHVAGLSITECADHQIQVAVAVEVRGLDVGDAWQAANRRGRESARSQSPQPDDRAFVVIARQELAEVGHQQILDPVAIEIDGLAAGRIRQLRNRREAGRWIVGAAQKHHAVPHVAHDQLQPRVAVQIHQFDVGHDRRGRCRRGTQSSPRECGRGRFGRPWPWRRQRRGGVGFVPCQGGRGISARSDGAVASAFCSEPSCIRCMRMTSSRQAALGRTSAGGSRWHDPQSAVGGAVF